MVKHRKTQKRNCSTFLGCLQRMTSTQVLNIVQATSSFNLSASEEVFVLTSSAIESREDPEA